MDIPIGANVSCHDGSVGESTDVIVDLVSEQVTHFVVNPGTHRGTHLVLRQHNWLDKWIITVPVSVIERSEMDTVILKIDKGAV